LGKQFKESNRSQADHISAKLQAVHCRVAPLDRLVPRTKFQFTPEEIELLAEMEHKRWMAERLEQGWKPGATRDDAKKIHPYLVPYEDLEELVKDYDREPVRSIPSLLREAGYEIVRMR
jgi:hypothetical protein